MLVVSGTVIVRFYKKQRNKSELSVVSLLYIRNIKFLFCYSTLFEALQAVLLLLR